MHSSSWIQNTSSLHRAAAELQLQSNKSSIPPRVTPTSFSLLLNVSCSMSEFTSRAGTNQPRRFLPSEFGPSRAAAALLEQFELRDVTSPRAASEPCRSYPNVSAPNPPSSTLFVFPRGSAARAFVCVCVCATERAPHSAHAPAVRHTAALQSRLLVGLRQHHGPNRAEPSGSSSDT